jgi:NAD(P)-dependent dehydrogenase (short-subunit alcohol dehydrogenase family)
MKEIALITGAARNIGKGIAKTLVGAGYQCILVDKDSVALREAFNELNGNENCFEYTADISDFEQIEQLHKWLRENHHSLTVLINNAAYESPVSIRDINPNEIKKSFQTNLEGPIYLTNLLVKDWLKNKTAGNIVFTSSVHSQIIRTRALYSSSKAAIEMFVKEAALELGESGIRVNAVAPGPTQDTEQLKPDFRVPLGYYQQPQDIGEAVKFLISKQARFITGQSLTVDGGYSLTHVHHWLKKGKLSA